MKKISLFVAVAVLSFAVAMPVVYAPVAHADNHGVSSMDNMRKKRYRYRKRTHRVQVSGQGYFYKDVSVEAGLLYGYNFGYFELGPNVNFAWERGDELDWGAGLYAEFNIIKNTRKEKFVPAIGFKTNYLFKDKHLQIAPHLALKYFPASRTGLILNIRADMRSPLNKFGDLFKNLGVGWDLAYAHYFHF